MLEVALVTGISGQDGNYLSKILIENDYKVVGLVRDKSMFNDSKLEYLSIHNDVTIEEVDMLDYNSLLEVFEKYKPSKVFNFASQSSVGLSYSIPKETLEFNIQSLVNLLECIREINLKIRLFQASSSEIYGNTHTLPINEDTPINPENIYATSKAVGHSIIENYRDIFGLHVSSAIFFNHESALRGDNFVIKKIVSDLVKIKYNQLDRLVIGNIDIKRDFGYAPKYMEAVYAMLMQEKCDDYVLSSGKSLSIREIIYYILDKLGLDRSVIYIDKSLFRVNDIENTYGDSTKAFKTLNWSYDIDFFSVIDELIQYEKKYNKRVSA